MGFFVEDWSRKGHVVEVRGVFSYKSLQKRWVRKFGKVETQKQVLYSLISAIESMLAAINEVKLPYVWTKDF